MSKVTDTTTENRKADHIRINLEKNVQFPHTTTGLEKYSFIHQAIPEINLKAVDTSLTLFGKLLAAPILISSMTGGTEMAHQINQNLAKAAQIHKVAMGLGSQRAAIENPELAYSYRVRDVAPDILLFANLGAIQLNYRYGVDECQRAVDMVEADALILHFNVLQEAVQPEGDTDFAGLLNKVEAVCKKLPIPVIAKEVGWGFSEQNVRDLANAGVSAIDVAGAGGTSWSEVEYHRAPTAFHAQVARCFADWGIPTADAVQYAVKAAPHLPVIASGGLRDGVDVAKCIALGAVMGGIAGPFLKAADQSCEAVDELIRQLVVQLRVAMLCSGAANIAQLQQTPLNESIGIPVLVQLAARYMHDLDATMRQIIDSLAYLPADFTLMLRYTMGWVDEHGSMYNQPTGKRIRPLLLLLCAEAAGGSWRDALPAAAAVEFLHNFSLIHDDIEDDSLTRHGRPTVWNIWGTANAINAGDALFTVAFHALQTLNQTGIAPDCLLTTWGIFNRTAIELTRGQHLDMRFEHQSTVSVEDYLSMITGKSAALVAACAHIGALIGGNNTSVADNLASFGLNLGIAFQIRDDILGIWGDPGVTGKSAATDILSRKKSLPVLHALSQNADLSHIYAREHLGEADVSEALKILEQTNAQSYTEMYERQYYEQALTALKQSALQGEAGLWLADLAESLFQRTH